ncbi:MAG: hypothetical protein SFY67_19320 [Candidatus Melainabacteria bacterium]|nr:hypothetical protein [Candidatus Melainabacteria bacterium]
MGKLIDVVDLKEGKFFKQPTFVVQDVVPVDDVSKSIIEHARFNYTFSSLTPINSGPHGGRILMLFQYTG